MTQNKVTLVTGANGFIGKNLCRTLQEQGRTVRALIRKDMEGPWGEVVISDLATNDLPPKTLENVGTVFHLAGKAHAVNEVNSSQDDYRPINVGGTQKLLTAAAVAGVEKFIFCSSIKAMGEGSDIPQKESDPALPVTFYGKSKLEAEKLVIDATGIPYTSVFRPAMVYGPDNPGNLGRMINAISKGFFPPFPKLKNKRSMVHVDDVIAAALLLEANENANRQVYNVTDGEYYSTSDIINWIRAELGKTDQNIGTPLIILKSAALLGDALSFLIRKKLPLTTDNLEKLIGSSAYSSDKICTILDFKPQYDLKKALPNIMGLGK